MNDNEMLKAMAVDFFSSSFDEEKNNERIIDLIHRVIQMGPENAVVFIGNCKSSSTSLCFERQGCKSRQRF